MKKMHFATYLTALTICVAPSVHALVEKQDTIRVTDQLLEQNNQIQEKYDFQFQGQNFVGYPNVFSPVVFAAGGTHYDLVIHPGEHFLELGCGTGVFSILAALDGAASVTAVDINPDAVANARENVVLHGLSDKMTVLHGDLFQPIPAEQRFDVIFFNVPFTHRDCTVDDLPMIARSVYDPEHHFLHRYIKEGRDHLAPGGRMLLCYSTTHGDIDLMFTWAEKYDWEVSLLYQIGKEGDFITVEFYQFLPKGY